MASTKGDGGDCGKGKEAGRIAWTQSEFDALIDLCIEIVQKSKGKTGATTFQRIQWKKLAEDFQKRTNKPWNKNKLKHKYDWMRNRWILWTKLKGKETGLGWDHVKKTIAASDEWWEAKIKENDHFKVFREGGIAPELESKMEFLFDDSFATGQYKHTPGYPCPSSNVVDVNDSRSGHASPQIDLSHGHDDDYTYEGFGRNNDVDDAWNDLWREPTQNDYDESRKRKRGFESNDSLTGKGAKTGSTRKLSGREFFEDKIGDMCQAMLNRNYEVTSFFQSMNASSGSTSSSLKDEECITNALAKLCTLDGLVPASTEFSFAISMMNDPFKRLVLAKLPSDEAIVGWINFMYAERKKD